MFLVSCFLLQVTMVLTAGEEGRGEEAKLDPPVFKVLPAAAREPTRCSLRQVEKSATAISAVPEDVPSNSWSFWGLFCNFWIVFDLF
jgi:hypothetical protein